MATSSQSSIASEHHMYQQNTEISVFIQKQVSEALSRLHRFQRFSYQERLENEQELFLSAYQVIADKPLHDIPLRTLESMISNSVDEKRKELARSQKSFSRHEAGCSEMVGCDAADSTDNVVLRVSIQLATSTLPSLQKSIVEMLYAGYCEEEITSALGISSECFASELASVRKVFALHGLNY